MTITITAHDRRELNRILGLLKSPDLESKNLGIDLFLTSSVLTDFRSMWYVSNSGNDVPVDWYISKVNQIRREQKKENIDNPYAYIGLILPIVESILQGAPRFKAHILIDFEEEKI